MKTNTVKNQRGVSRALLGTSVILLSLFMSGCSAHAQHHQQNHHKPHVSVSFEYDYYPGQHVYYDRHNHLYHYNHYRQGWLTVRVLPVYIHLDYNRRHRLAYRHNRPWRESHAHKRHYTHSDQKHYQHKQRRHYDKYDHRVDRKVSRHAYKHERQHERKHERRDDRQNRREHYRDNRRHDEQRTHNGVHKKRDRKDGHRS